MKVISEENGKFLLNKIQHFFNNNDPEICTKFVDNKTKFFTLVAGIRPVKDPTYLLQAFSGKSL